MVEFFKFCTEFEAMEDGVGAQFLLFASVVIDIIWCARNRLAFEKIQRNFSHLGESISKVIYELCSDLS